MVKPISPEEAKHAKQDVIPQAVIAVVNKLLKERFNGRSARLMQAEVLHEALACMRADGASVSEDDFFDRHWLDFEQLYRDAGWKVVYDQPAYNESYEASWRFEKE